MGRHKYIFVLGGVMSGVGKGITSASIAKLLSARGFKVSPIKIDPYINVDAGTMNPIEHGEVFVLDSGLECDQDMGSYERFLDTVLPRENYMTTGMVYKTVIDRERNLEYQGRCVEAIPHITQEILQRIERSVAITNADITLIEIGGTVGEYQNVLFIEAARRLKMANPHDVIFVLVSYLPIPGKIGEMKTKPTQSAVREVNAHGIQPDIIIARSERPLDAKRKEKIADSCGMLPEHVISAPDVENVYDVPINFERDGISHTITHLLDLPESTSDLSAWQTLVDHIHHPKQNVKIGIIGKYFKTGDFVLSDVYLSVIEALKHASWAAQLKPEFDWIDSTDFEADPSALARLNDYAGIVVPGGFGGRGVEGKIAAIQYVREHGIPYLGLCYGMQLAVIEYARHVAGMPTAHTTEVDAKTPFPVIDILPEQRALVEAKTYGGSMRLGGFPAALQPDTIAARAYAKTDIRERHRHRYEVNPAFVDALKKAGLVFSGTSPDGRLMEIAELPREEHPFFVGTQFHPEFLSSPLHPHPLFAAFVEASKKRI